jgi:RsiW-degrading membrane proteinase PrsW (M82 family)
MAILLFCGSIWIGIVPMMLYSILLWWIDRWEKEPPLLLLAVFLWGFIPAAGFAIISQVALTPLEGLFGAHTFGADVLSNSLIAPLTEEFLKGLAVLAVFLFWQRELDSIVDGIVYAGVVGCGFAAMENVLYFWSGLENVGQWVVLVALRAFVFGLNHAFFTSWFGIGLVKARYSPSRLGKISWVLLGFSFAIGSHALHNLLATVGTGESILLAVVVDWLGVVGCAAMIVISLWRESKRIQHYLAPEVQNGTLSAQQAQIAGTFWQHLRPTPRSQRVFYQNCAELAAKLHQFEKLDKKAATLAEIERLRAYITEISPQIST